jgi:hypothetical protein
MSSIIYNVNQVGVDGPSSLCGDGGCGSKPWWPGVHLRRKLRVYVTAYVGEVVSDADLEGGSPKTFYGDLDS